MRQGAVKIRGRAKGTAPSRNQVLQPSSLLAPADLAQEALQDQLLMGPRCGPPPAVKWSTPAVPSWGDPEVAPPPPVQCAPRQERVPPDPLELLPGFRARDAVPEDVAQAIDTEDGNDHISGKHMRKSLMQPQGLAARILPREECELLAALSTAGCPAECGPPWEPEVAEAARRAGPHTSAMTPENVELIWEDITCQQEAGFVRMVSHQDLFSGEVPAQLKMSRIAVVPQSSRRGRIILNLSAEVDLGVKRATGRRRWKQVIHPSVNETTEPAEEQAAVKALGTASSSLPFFMHEAECSWEIDWHKIDLSDGFWRMIVETGKECNFVFQMPRRADDEEVHCVAPSSLQMGWKNSPAFFCTGTEATRSLSKRLLALTVASGINVHHRHESHCTPAAPGPNCDPVGFRATWRGLRDAELMARVFVDDFMHGLAGDPKRPERGIQQLWVARAALHAIHAVFPPPDVVDHHGGKDSVSVEKLKKGDALFKLEEVLLGFLLSGGAGAHRTVAVPKEKCGKHADRLEKALQQKSRWIPFNEFQKIHGQMQHVSTAIPCFRGLMTPLNKVLSKAPEHVGLRRGSAVRNAFRTFATLLHDAQKNPSHITETVGPDLPHCCGTTDASGVGAGGAWLPCTEWIHPVAWRVEWPRDVTAAVQDGSLSMVDCRHAACFTAECMIDDLTERPAAGLSTFAWTDNSPVAHIVRRQATRATSEGTEAFLQWLALRQRWTRRGPQDCAHCAGASNLMADFASRSFEEGFPDADDEGFFEEFTNRFSLPPQLWCWSFARPRAEIFSAAVSLLRKHVDQNCQATTAVGKHGVGLPQTLASTLSCADCRATPMPTRWGEKTCSWPLLRPCGAVCTTMDADLRARRSRASCSKSPTSWSNTDLETLAARIRDNTC